MADEKLNTRTGEQKIPKAPEPVAADTAPAPDLTAEPAPAQGQPGPAQPETGDVTIRLMSSWQKSGRRPGQKLKKRVIPLSRNLRLLRRSILPLLVGNLGSRAGAIRPLTQ